MAKKNEQEMPDRPTMELPAGYKVEFPPVPPSIGMKGFWECPKADCAFTNADVRTHCFQCNTPKPP